MRAWIKLACVVLAWTIMPAGIASAGSGQTRTSGPGQYPHDQLQLHQCPPGRQASFGGTDIDHGGSGRQHGPGPSANPAIASPAATTRPVSTPFAWRHPVGHRGPVWCPWRLACPVRGQPNSHRPRPRRPERGHGPARARSGHAGPVHGHGRGHAVRDRGPVRCPWRLACPVRGQPLGHRRRPRRRSRRNRLTIPSPATSPGRGSASGSRPPGVRPGPAASVYPARESGPGLPAGGSSRPPATAVARQFRMPSWLMSVLLAVGLLALVVFAAELLRWPGVAGAVAASSRPRHPIRPA